MAATVFYAEDRALAPLKDGQARQIDLFGAPLPSRSALVPKADADRLAEALREVRGWAVGEGSRIVDDALTAYEGPHGT